MSSPTPPREPSSPVSLPALALVLMTLGLVAGLYHLLDLRLEQGDAYAPYSSLRSDPRGGRALHDALTELTSLRVERNFDAPERLLEGGRWNDETPPLVFVSGVDGGRDDRGLAVLVRGLAARGARVVLTIDPQSRASWRFADARRERPSGPDDDADDGVEGDAEGDDAPEAAGAPSSEEEGASPDGEAADDADDRSDRELDLFDILDARGGGLRLRRRALESVDGESDEKLPVIVERTLESTDPITPPATLSWRSPWVVSFLPPRWRPIYRRAGEAVVAERALGRGEVVLLTDSYPISNEGLATDPQPELLRWLLADRDHVIFDEYHLGVRTGTGMLALAERYRLDGFFIALLLAASLFVWRTAQPFVPPAERRRDTATTTGRRTSQALVTLLDRGVPRDRLLAESLERWRRGASQTIAESLDAELHRIAKAARHPLAGYEAVRRRLHETPHRQRVKGAP